MADLTYSDSAASIRKNQWFRDRVEISTSKYSNYLMNTDAGDPEQDTKVAYGQRLAQMSMTIVDQLMFVLSGDAEVLAAGPAIPDASLQPIVEKMIGKLYPMPTTPPAGMGYSQPYPPPPMRQ